MPRWLPDDIDVASVSERNRRAWAEQEAKRATQIGKYANGVPADSMSGDVQVGCVPASPEGGHQRTNMRAVGSSGPLTPSMSGGLRDRQEASSPGQERLTKDVGCNAPNQSGWPEPPPLTLQRAKADAAPDPRRLVNDGAIVVAKIDGEADAASSAPLRSGPPASPQASPPVPAVSAAPVPCLVGKSMSKSVYPLVGLCRSAGLPEPIPEYKFHPQRKWRADYCWPIHRVIVEIDGGAWTNGRHTRGAGFIKDMEKLNAAALLGFFVLRYTPQQLGQAIHDLRLMFAR